MSSKYSKKRRQDDEDTSEFGGSRRTRHRSSSGSPSPARQRKNPKSKDEDNEPAESMSIEATNKIRASLGLAPLEVEDNKIRDADDGTNEKIYNEDGFEFRHRKAENISEKKKESSIKEKLEVSKTKRDVYSKVLKAKKLADSDDEDGSAANWIDKMRKKDIEAEKAAERAKIFDQLDEDMGVSNLISEERAKKVKKSKKREDNGTGGLVIGHSRDQFIEGNQILVLEDKGVLDDGDEVLVNPNLLENERHKRNVELKKRKDPHRNYDEDVDEFGNPKNFGVLAKYDNDLDGVPRERFRLDEKGGVDLAEEKREMEMYQKLKMAGKRLESLEMPKYQLASEFYTQEEMVSFRKVKKGKKEKNTRKRKTLKASDLVPVEKAGEGKSSDFGRRRRQASDDEEETEQKMEIGKDIKNEEEETEAGDGKWKKAMNGNGVDLARLQKLKQKAIVEDDDEDSDEDNFTGGVDLTGVVIDDNAEDELHSVLSKTRKVRQVVKEEDVGQKVHDMLSSHGVKMEYDDEDSNKDAGLFMDSTVEYCRHVGEIRTIGLGGNRDDNVDVSELKKEVEEEDGEGFEKWKRTQVDRELREKEKRRNEEKGGWLAAGKPAPSSSSAKIDSDDEDALELAKKHKFSDDSDDDEDGEYEPALGREADVTKGVGAMLKLATQKGYLTDPNSKMYSGPSLDHLKNRVRTQIDGSKFDIEDKYMKKLDRLGTTGRGPIQTFVEKTDYKPEVNISYVDRKGRELDAKDAYRELSYKFHGRNPGKKQLEKRQNRKDKEEKMMKTNSYDTPLGTLSKQLKKQKQLATPYLVLSGSNDHSSLKKE